MSTSGSRCPWEGGSSIHLTFSWKDDSYIGVDGDTQFCVARAPMMHPFRIDICSEGCCQDGPQQALAARLSERGKASMPRAGDARGPLPSKARLVASSSELSTWTLRRARAPAVRADRRCKGHAVSVRAAAALAMCQSSGFSPICRARRSAWGHAPRLANARESADPAVALAAGALVPLPSFAWCAEGHRLVAADAQ